MGATSGYTFHTLAREAGSRLRIRFVQHCRVSIYIYICICIRVCMHVHTSVYTYICVYIYMCYMCVYIYTHKPYVRLFFFSLSLSLFLSLSLSLSLSLECYRIHKHGPRCIPHSRGIGLSGPPRMEVNSELWDPLGRLGACLNSLERS